jgi:hypothetical protein
VIRTTQISVDSHSQLGPGPRAGLRSASDVVWSLAVRAEVLSPVTDSVTADGAAVMAAADGSAFSVCRSVGCCSGGASGRRGLRPGSAALQRGSWRSAAACRIGNGYPGGAAQGVPDVGAEDDRRRPPEDRLPIASLTRARRRQPARDKTQCTRWAVVERRRAPRPRTLRWAGVVLDELYIAECCCLGEIL